MEKETKRELFKIFADYGNIILNYSIVDKIKFVIVIGIATTIIISAFYLILQFINKLLEGVCK